MNPFALLLPVGLVLAVGSWLTYHPAAKVGWRVPLALAALAGANGLIWGLIARWAASPRQLYTVGVCWDVLNVAAYSLLPLFVFGVRLTPAAALGVALVVAGACMVKWG